MSTDSNIYTKCIPSFIVIGAQKAGTTALFSLLARHPQIVAPKIKEIDFFQDDNNYGKGYGWYLEHFPKTEHLEDGKITYEASPGYLYRPPTPERIFHYNKNMKLIMLVRDPVDRAYSAWNMYKNFRNSPTFFHLTEKRSFEQAIGQEFYELVSGKRIAYTDLVNNENCTKPFPGYISRGLYYEQLLRYLRYFPRDQILILHSSDLRCLNPKVVADITQFLGLTEFKFNAVESLDTNAGDYSAKCENTTSQILKEFYRPFNEMLYNYVGLDYGWCY